MFESEFPTRTGPELQDRLSVVGSTLPIVFLTGHGDIPMSVRAIKAGASDFLTKPISKEVLFDAIERAVERYLVVGEQQAQLNALRGLVAELTPRERQVFGLVAQGRQNKQIALGLGIAVRTVKVHRQRVMVKTQGQNDGRPLLDRRTSGHNDPEHWRTRRGGPSLAEKMTAPAVKAAVIEIAEK